MTERLLSRRVVPYIRMAKERYLLTLTPGLGARIDAARGETPRTQWIERAIEQALGIGETEAAAVSRSKPGRTTASRRSNGGTDRIPTTSVSPEPVPAPAESLSPIEAERRRRNAYDRAYIRPR